VVCVEDRLLDALSNTAVAVTSTSLTVATVTSSDFVPSVTTPGILDPSPSSTMIVAEVPPVLVEDSVVDPRSIVPVPSLVHPSIKPSTTASSAAGKKAVSGLSSWDRPELMLSLPWLQWRGVSIVPRGSDSPPSIANSLVVASTSISAVDTVPVSISDSENPLPSSIREVCEGNASLSCQLQFDDVEHTLYYRDEELEKELEVALSRRGSKGNTRAISKGSSAAARDAPCILRRKVIPRTGPNRAQAVDRAQTGQGQVPQGLGPKDVPAGLHGGLASILAANREASEKRSYSMINRKASTRNQVHSKKEGSSTLDSGEFNILRVKRNEAAEIDKEKNKEKEESKISIISRSPIRASMPVMRSVFQSIGPEAEFNPSDFVAAAIPNGNAVKKTDFKTAKGGPGRIRGDWITALIAGGPPSGPGVKTVTDPGSVIPKIVAAKSSSFRKKPSRDHNEDDFTAVEDVSGINTSTIPASAPKGISASGSGSQPVKAPMSAKIPSAPGVLNKIGPKLKVVNSNTTSISTSNVGEGDVPRTFIKQDKLARKREDSVDFPAPTLKKKRALEDVKAHFPALSSLNPTLVSTSSATSSNQDPAGSKSEMNLISFKQWKMNQDLKSNDSPTQEEKDKIANLVHRAPSPSHSLRPPMGFMSSNTLPPLTPSLPPSSSKIPSVAKLPPTFKVVPRPPPPSAIRSSPQDSSVGDERREKSGDHQDDMNRMDVVTDSRISSKVSDFPEGGSGSRSPSAEDFTVSVTSATPTASSASTSTPTAASNSSLKSPTRTDGVPTARTMHASITGGVIVSGTLQRAKPGPKPRLQFTSDGDNSTVRVMLYCVYLGSVIHHLAPVSHVSN
jgi:hypothetical protein